MPDRRAELISQDFNNTSQWQSNDMEHRAKKKYEVNYMCHMNGSHSTAPTISAADFSSHIRRMSALKL